MTLAGRRYIVCRNHQEAEKDAADRAAIVAALERQLEGATRRWSATPAIAASSRPTGDGHFAIDRAKVEEEPLRRHLRAAHQHRSQPARGHAALQAALDRGADLPHRQASARHAADLPQARRDHPRSRVLQLPRPRAQEGAGGPHRRARPHRAHGPTSSPISMH